MLIDTYPNLLSVLLNEDIGILLRGVLSACRVVRRHEVVV